MKNKQAQTYTAALHQLKSTTDPIFYSPTMWLWTSCAAPKHRQESLQETLTQGSLFLANSQYPRWAGFEFKLVIFSGEYPIPPAIKEKKASNKNELNLGKKK